MNKTPKTLFLIGIMELLIGAISLYGYLFLGGNDKILQAVNTVGGFIVGILILTFASKLRRKP